MPDESEDDPLLFKTQLSDNSKEKLGIIFKDTVCHGPPPPP
eukprot:SAG11_NODE_1249_length_5393_cov_4.349641_1_plen_40_part_10